MQQYQRLIYTVCLQFVHDPHTAEDLTQDTFLSAFSAIDRCEPQYYKAVARPRGRQQMQGPLEKQRGCAGWTPRGTTPCPSRAERPAATPHDPAQQRGRPRRGRRSWKLLVRGLREPYGRIAVLYFLEHRDHRGDREAAVGRPPATVNSQLWRAKQHPAPADHREEAEGMSLYFDNEQTL